MFATTGACYAACHDVAGAACHAASHVLDNFSCHIACQHVIRHVMIRLMTLTVIEQETATLV